MYYFFLAFFFLSVFPKLHCTGAPFTAYFTIIIGYKSRRFQAAVCVNCVIWTESTQGISVMSKRCRNTVGQGNVITRSKRQWEDSSSVSICCHFLNILPQLKHHKPLTKNPIICSMNILGFKFILALHLKHEELFGVNTLHGSIVDSCQGSWTHTGPDKSFHCERNLRNVWVMSLNWWSGGQISSCVRKFWKTSCSLTAAATGTFFSSHERVHVKSINANA